MTDQNPRVDPPFVLRCDASYVQVGPGVFRIENVFPDSFAAYQTVRAGGHSEVAFSSLNLGAHVGDAPDRVIQNRDYLAKYCATNPVWLDQVHGVDVVDLDRWDASSGGVPTGDAAVSSRPGQGCAVLTADCLPILVSRTEAQSCLAIHAGWRGLLAGVIERGLERLLERQAGPDQWSVWLGPCIGEQMFEVGAEVREAFLSRDLQSASAFSPKEGQPDKFIANLRQLAEDRIFAWISAHHPILTGKSEIDGPKGALRIARSNECTVLQGDRYFSYRRDGQTGRMASLIARRTLI